MNSLSSRLFDVQDQRKDPLDPLPDHVVVVRESFEEIGQRRGDLLSNAERRIPAVIAQDADEISRAEQILSKLQDVLQNLQRNKLYRLKVLAFKIRRTWLRPYRQATEIGFLTLPLRIHQKGKAGRRGI